MPWSRTLITKCILLTVVLLISVQYLVNVALLRRNESVILFNIIDASIGKIWNQTNVYAQERMRSSVTTSTKKLKSCDVISPHLKGHVKVNTQVAAWAQIEEENSNLLPGGRYQPSECMARNRIAVVIPFRDRDIHLKIFMRNIHPFLQSQQLDYGIFVVEMAANITFNRALLMNVGFVEAMKSYNYQCFIFHDVDLLPEDDRNLYTCPTQPRHMSVAIDSLKYKLPYPQIFGGVSAITVEHFKKINGFSNIFFGWGGEDDDMYRRLLYANLTVTRYSPEVARYKMLVHVKDHGNPDRHTLLKTVKARQGTDGLGSLKYQVIKSELRPLYTWILISVNQSEIIENEPIHKLILKNLKNVKKPKTDLKSKVHTINSKVDKKEVKVINEKRNADSGLINTNKQQIVQKQNEILRNPDLDKIKKQPSINHPQKTENKKPVRKTKPKYPTRISWIPANFKGILPINLTKLQPLPIIDIKKRTGPKQGVVRPNMAKQGVVRPNIAKQGVVRPNIAKQGVVRPNIAKQGVVRQNIAKQGVVRPNITKQGVVRPNIANNVVKSVNVIQPQSDQKIIKVNVPK